MLQATVGGAGAALLATAIYEFAGGILAPGAMTNLPVSAAWQTRIAAQLLVTLLVATGLSIEDRRIGDRAIVDAYHQRLMRLGVTDYDIVRCWDDYRYALFQAPFITVLGALVAQATERGDRMFTIMAARSAAAIEDLDAFSLLSR